MPDLIGQFELGVRELEAGRFAAAAAAFERWLNLHGSDAEGWYNLGLAHYGGLDLRAAAQAWQQALAHAGPEQGELLHALFDAADELYGAHLLPEAIGLFRQLLAFESLAVHATQRLSWCLHQCGEDREALAVLDQGVARWPRNPGFRLVRALLLPRFYASTDEMRWWRQHLLSSLDELEAWLQDEPELSMSPMQLHSPIFGLLSLGEDEKPVLQRISALWQRIFLDPRQPGLASAAPQPRIRIAMVSVSVFDHSTMHYFLGMLELLAGQADFTSGLFYFNTIADDWTGRIRGLVDEFVQLAPSLPAARDALLAWQPDILFYLDIGQDALLYTLAHLRLGRVQCVSAGIPITTGIAALDYYLSSACFEPPEAQDHYSETLIRLEAPMVCMRPPRVNDPLKDRSAFGLDEGSHLYIFPHTLIRVDPELDGMIAQILQADPLAEILFIQDSQGQIYRRLQQRFGAAYPELLGRLRFFAPMEQADFLNLVACCDVALDSLRLGGGNVSFQCFWVGTPIIHCPTPFLRCRIAAGLYRLAGLEHWIAQDHDDYVAKALQLGRDRALREALSAQMLAARPRIFDRTDGIDEMFAYFRRWARAPQT